LKAVILAGGFGTRLRPLSCTRPKILFPIVNKPLLEWTFERLAKHNVDEVIIAANFQSETAMKQHRMSHHGLKVKYSRDPPSEPLGSGGPIKKAERLIGHEDSFLTLNGDVFADISYTELLEKHRKTKALATIALTKVKEPSRYGVAVLDKNGRIQEFIEKPAKGKAPSNLINAGAYALNAEIFEYIPSGKKVSIEREIFTKLAQEGKLYGHVFEGLWFDIGKPEDYLQVNRTLMNMISNRPKLRVKGKVTIKNPVAFDKGVRIAERSVIGPNAVLGKNVIIGKNVHLKETTVFPQTVISDFCSINGAIIGDNVAIGKRAKIERGCILGDHVKIGDNITLAAGVSVCPAKEITKSILTSKNIC